MLRYIIDEFLFLNTRWIASYAFNSNVRTCVRSSFQPMLNCWTICTFTANGNSIYAVDSTLSCSGFQKLLSLSSNPINLEWYSSIRSSFLHVNHFSSTCPKYKYCLGHPTLNKVNKSCKHSSITISGNWTGPKTESNCTEYIQYFVASLCLVNFMQEEFAVMQKYL